MDKEIMVKRSIFGTRLIRSFYAFSTLALCSCVSFALHAADLAESEYDRGLVAMEHCKWHDVVKHFGSVTKSYPHSEYAKGAYFNLGVGLFHTGELEEANMAFSDYLKNQNEPQLFEEVFRYKLSIANAFSGGERRRMFGIKPLPKWLSAQELAEEIYDEIIAVLPAHDLAAQALFAKAKLYWSVGEFRDAVDTYQILIKRFPRHPLAIESHLNINKVYVEQSIIEFQNPDIIALAELNAKKFRAAFPSEERLCLADNDVLRIKETYACGLYETGLFYERIKQKNSSIVYYQNALQRFPETSAAMCCQQRLLELGAPICCDTPNE
jgi:outer membrane protein assembly factor BamD (BamD/ComL family)